MSPAYFTDAMGGEFKKALEEAMQKLDEDNQSDSSKGKKKSNAAKARPTLRGRKKSSQKRALKSKKHGQN